MELNLKENYVLMCLRPDKGYLVNAGTGFTYGLAGAIVLDLMLQEKVTVLKDRIQVPLSRPDPDKVYNDVLHRIRKNKKPAKVKALVANLGMHTGKFKRIIFNSLLMAGYLRREERSFLFFHYSRYHIGKREYLASLVQDLTQVLSGKTAPQDFHLALLTLLDASYGLKSFLPDRTARKEASKKIKDLIKQDWRFLKVFEVIRETYAAVAALTATTAASV